ncbi:MAG: hypothetical protein H5T99_03800 [Moorella sp. (in: Bacteria)]|nr:hypothetical protein [Moorella sp. (in: firmicutes)]
MFKGMHPIFWVGLVIMYGLTFIFMLWEILTPTSTYHVTIFGVPAPFIYNNIFMLYIVSLFLGWLWYYVPERAEKRRREMAATTAERERRD